LLDKFEGSGYLNTGMC